MWADPQLLLCAPWRGGCAGEGLSGGINGLTQLLQEFYSDEDIARAAQSVGCGFSDEQRYLFDLNG